ncbi:hypothetical protein WJX81_008209 [Elliptochloris bilobata]|uniref:Uncharacterized protein n=1 Tax=Elliptochloris bilobata TaxID=381761 RepID=A0AAW1S154_9CHLO
MGTQSATAGMLPPSDSDEDDEPVPAKKAGQPATAGMLPPSSSDEDDSSSEEEDEEKPKPRTLQPAVVSSKPKKGEEEIDPEQARKDLERLELTRKKREDDRLKRIRDEGWDRFAPVTDTNKPPDLVPADHPSRKEAA